MCRIEGIPAGPAPRANVDAMKRARDRMARAGGQIARGGDVVRSAIELQSAVVEHNVNARAAAVIFRCQETALDILT